jgi:hypothetical protein
MATSERIRALIADFAAEWLDSPSDQTHHELLCGCVEKIVEEAVHEAILTTAKVFKP